MKILVSWASKYGSTEEIARHLADALASKPTWLFSSGPLGTERVDKDGKGLLQSAEPAELPELKDLAQARRHQVFFGKVDPKKLSAFARLVRAMPEGRKLIPEGDFRQWEAIDQFAVDIALELAEGTRPEIFEAEPAPPAP